MNDVFMRPPTKMTTMTQYKQLSAKTKYNNDSNLSSRIDTKQNRIQIQMTVTICDTFYGNLIRFVDYIRTI